MSDRLLLQENFYKTTLSQNIANDSTRIYVTTAPTKIEGYLVISQYDNTKREIIYYTSVGANYVDTPASGGRGLGGTTAQSHDAAEAITMDDVAEYHNPIINILSNYISGCGLSVTGGTDDITAATGSVVINGSGCSNVVSNTISDIGASGTNKSGNVASGGIRYIYAQDDEDGTWSLYISNNTSETGKRRLGFAKFNESSTTVIRYIQNDDDYSPFVRGIIVDWVGPPTDIPVSFSLCNGTNGTPDCADKFSITAGATYTYGVTGGAATVTLITSQIPSHTHTGSTGTESADHGHSGQTGNTNTDHYHGWGGWSGYANADHTHSTWTDTQGAHSHEYRSGAGSTSEGYAANTNIDDHRQATESAGGHGHNIGMSSGGEVHQHYTSGTTSWQRDSYATNNHSHPFSTGGRNAAHTHSFTSNPSGSDGSHANMPPYIALVRIMKL